MRGATGQLYTMLRHVYMSLDNYPGTFGQYSRKSTGRGTSFGVRSSEIEFGGQLAGVSLRFSLAATEFLRALWRVRLRTSLSAMCSLADRIKCGPGAANRSLSKMSKGERKKDMTS